MPRQARIDAPGALQHIICRGIGRRKIFLNDVDRNDFVDRLSRIISDTDTVAIEQPFPSAFTNRECSCHHRYAPVVDRSAVSFNRRHRRNGRLFQNHYKSILCQEDPYLLELVRYIHLNPLRAGIVKDLDSLDAVTNG